MHASVNRPHPRAQTLAIDAFVQGNRFSGFAKIYTVSSNESPLGHLNSQGLISRPVRAYGLTDNLRLTIGGEEANRGVVAPLNRLMRETRGV